MVADPAELAPNESRQCAHCVLGATDVVLQHHDLCAAVALAEMMFRDIRYPSHN